MRRDKVSKVFADVSLNVLQTKAFVLRSHFGSRLGSKHAGICIALLKKTAMAGSASIDGATSPAPPQGDRREGTGVLVERDEANSCEFVEKLKNSDDGQAGAPRTAG